MKISKHRRMWLINAVASSIWRNKNVSRDYAYNYASELIDDMISESNTIGIIFLKRCSASELEYELSLN